MPIVSLVGGAEDFEQDPVDEAFWSLPTTPPNARRRFVVERIEIAAEQADIDAELAREGVLDAELVALLRNDERVSWKVRPSQYSKSSARSNFFRCARGVAE